VSEVLNRGGGRRKDGVRSVKKLCTAVVARAQVRHERTKVVVVVWGTHVAGGKGVGLASGHARGANPEVYRCYLPKLHCK
jgi:hypothetical protein